jgi:pimeloyl-ACP methyl ester carboxylesterase
MLKSIEEVILFCSLDGFNCNLIHLIGKRKSKKGPVLLVHGAGVRANIFRPPVERTFVDYLFDNGYDVWLENWRASIDFPANPWTLDQAAAYDHPAAVQTVLKHTGHSTLKAVIHCQGSTSFMMSAVAGLLPEVSVIVSNAVSLHPQVNRVARLKLRYAAPFLNLMSDYVNPQWGEYPDSLLQLVLKGLVELTHHECSNSVCKFASFTYGYGFPVLWRHENLDNEIHDWIRREFGNVSLRFFKQMRDCVYAGHLVAAESLLGLPHDFTAVPPRTNARIALIAGELNDCFNWKSQQTTFNWLQSFRPDYHSLRIFKDYGHLDVFIGKNAVNDTFPVILEELDKPI